MKQKTKIWLGVVLAVGIVWSQPLAVLAQANDATQTGDQPVAVTAATTNNITDETGGLTGDTNVSGITNENYPSQRRRGPVVSIGGRATLAAGDSAEVVVAIGGPAKAGGKVQDAVVAVGGDATADADVGDAVVAVGGNATAHGK